MEKLLHNALYLWDCELNFLVCHTCQVIVQVIKQQKVAATHLIRKTRYITKRKKSDHFSSLILRSMPKQLTLGVNDLTNGHNVLMI